MCSYDPGFKLHALTKFMKTPNTYMRFRAILPFSICVRAQFINNITSVYDVGGV